MVTLWCHQAISSNPDDVMLVTDFNKLDTILLTVLQKACVTSGESNSLAPKKPNLMLCNARNQIDLHKR